MNHGSFSFHSTLAWRSPAVRPHDRCQVVAICLSLSLHVSSTHFFCVSCNFASSFSWLPVLSCCFNRTTFLFRWGWSKTGNRCSCYVSVTNYNPRPCAACDNAIISASYRRRLSDRSLRRLFTEQLSIQTAVVSKREAALKDKLSGLITWHSFRTCQPALPCGPRLCLPCSCVICFPSLSRVVPVCIDLHQSTSGGLLSAEADRSL